MKEMKYVRDLRIGAVLKDRPGVEYKILGKSPCSVKVLRTEWVPTVDDSVMPARVTYEEKSSTIHIAPTARLADFEGWRGAGTGRAGEEGVEGKP